MKESDARFEFRCWARNFGMVDTRLRRLSKCHGIVESEELYIVTSADSDANIKIRDGILDLKDLIDTRGDLERWRPRMKCGFPLAAALLEAEVLPELGVAMPQPRREIYDSNQFLEEVVLTHQELVVATVFKRRFAFTVNGCMTELDEVWINGAGLHSIAVESTDPVVVSETRHVIGLDELENVNYLQAIKRVIGMAPLRMPY